MANSSVRTCKESALGLKEGRIVSRDLVEEVILELGGKKPNS